MNACPRTVGLTILARKWSFYALRALRVPRTFTGLKNELRFTTNHILSRELKLLQAEGLIQQRETEYSITDAGLALIAAVEPLHNWGCSQMKLDSCIPSQACSGCKQYEANMTPKLKQVA